MKAILKYGISAYSGTIDDITFAAFKEGAVCIARKWVIPKPTPQNAELGSSTANLATIYADASAGFKADLKTFSELNGERKIYRKKISPSAYALFTKMMYAFAEDQGISVDLKTITLNDIQSLFSDLDNVAAAVAAGYLPNVPGASALTQAI